MKIEQLKELEKQGLLNVPTGGRLTGAIINLLTHEICLTQVEIRQKIPDASNHAIYQVLARLKRKGKVISYNTPYGYAYLLKTVAIANQLPVNP